MGCHTHAFRPFELDDRQLDPHPARTQHMQQLCPTLNLLLHTGQIPYQGWQIALNPRNLTNPR
jgi:hypothetical protein